MRHHARIRLREQSSLKTLIVQDFTLTSQDSTGDRLTGFLFRNGHSHSNMIRASRFEWFPHDPKNHHPCLHKSKRIGHPAIWQGFFPPRKVKAKHAVEGKVCRPAVPHAHQVRITVGQKISSKDLPVSRILKLTLPRERTE